MVPVSHSGSGREAVDGLEHLIRGVDHAGIGFVGALRQDHLDEFADHIHIGIFKEALLQRAETLRAAGYAYDGIAGGCGLEEVVVPGAAESAGIGEGGELKRANLLRLLLDRKSTRL